MIKRPTVIIWLMDKLWLTWRVTYSRSSIDFEAGERMIISWYASHASYTTAIQTTVVREWKGAVRNGSYNPGQKVYSICTWTKLHISLMVLLECIYVDIRRSAFQEYAIHFVLTWMNEWMNEWIYSLDRITDSQAGTPRHDNCVRLPVSWKPIRLTIDCVL